MARRASVVLAFDLYLAYYAPPMAVVALLVASIAALAAVGAWLAAVDSAGHARRSAAAAEETARTERDALHLSRTPSVTLVSDGEVVRGIGVTLTCTADLDVLRLELQQPPLHNGPRVDPPATVTGFWMSALDGVDFSTGADNHRWMEIRGVRANQRYAITLEFQIPDGRRPPMWAEADLRVVATRSGETPWVVPVTLARVDLRYNY